VRDADQGLPLREERRIAEIHLVVQAPTNHQNHIRFVDSRFAGVILVKIGKPHIGFTFLAQKLGMIGDIEDWYAQGAACGFELGFRTRPPDTMPADDHRALGVPHPVHDRGQGRGIWPRAGHRTVGAVVRALLKPCIGGEG
jgi:hypothetical protein